MNSIFQKAALVGCLLLSLGDAQSQVVNGYARVTSISGATLSLANVTELGDTFEDGEWIVLMQVQDDVLGEASNVSSFGSLSSIGNAGVFEICEIASHTESSGVPNTITLTEDPSNPFNTCSNCRVQIVSFRRYGSPNYTTTSDMSALDWNGNIGGVVAIHVEGVLTLNHSVSADEAGFQGGLVSVNYSGSACIASNVTQYRENNNQLGFKGESIYRRLDANYNNGRAKLLNGGGGGGNHNGGGGGGGNYTTGGQGGDGWNTCTSHPAGGLGGMSLSTEITSNRVFMGGGGGGGQQNNGVGRNGADGGGIILIRANEIVTTSGSGVAISANGGSPTNGGNDGSGGGGAGGSIVFLVNNWNIAAANSLTISANGGNGSSSLSGASHAGGGGGAQGVIIFNELEPTTDVVAETLNGSPGCGNTSNPCNSLAGSPTGSDNDGILVFISNALPIELIDFTAELREHKVLLNWRTQSEINNNYFEVQRSQDLEAWETLQRIQGAGNSSSEHLYTTWDPNPHFGTSYYRLKQKDFDGTVEYLPVVSVNRPYELQTLVVYPNPASDHISIMGGDIHLNEVIVYNSLGQSMNSRIEMVVVQQQLQMKIDQLSPGVYFIKSESGFGKFTVE